MHVLPARVGQYAAKAKPARQGAENALKAGGHGGICCLSAQVAAVFHAADAGIVSRAAHAAGKAQLGRPGVLEPIKQALKSGIESAFAAAAAAQGAHLPGIQNGDGWSGRRGGRSRQCRSQRQHGRVTGMVHVKSPPLRRRMPAHQKVCVLFRINTNS